MALTNTRERYGRVAQAFHWTTAMLIVVLLPMGLLMTWLPQGSADEVALKVFVYSLHKTLGVIVLAVAVLRIGWALYCIKPAPLHPERRLETFAAETVHWLLYAGIILAPVTGLLHHWTSIGFAPIWWPFGQDLPFLPKDEWLSVMFGYAHVGTAIVMALSVGAHIAGALKHTVIDRDQTLARMTSGEAATITAPATVAMHHGATLGAAALVLVAIVGGTSAYGLHGLQRPAVALAANEPDEAVGDDRWIVDHESSRLGVTVTQLGSPVEGQFEQWRADITFDPDALDQARVDVTIAAGSLTVGTVSSQAVGSDFLDAEAFPEARFVSEDFRQTGEGTFEAVGSLTIRDVSAPFVLPFELTIDGDVARMSASVAINRMDFGVGAQAQANEDAVAFTVGIDIDLTASLAVADAVAGS